MVATDPDGTEHPASTDVLDRLLAGLRGDRENLRAVALVSDVSVDGSDPVRVELEHAEGIAMAVLLRYSKKRFRKGIEYAGLEAAAAEPQVWIS